jgi:hypothetical protein
MGVLVVVDYILKTGEQQRNWLQMLHTTEQVMMRFVPIIYF